MLDLLIELQRLKGLNRTGWALRGLPPDIESVAAHSFGVETVTMLLADRLTSNGVKLDVTRMLRMALLHDWAEARIGDMPRTGTLYFGSEARRKAELQAFNDLIAGAGDQQELYRELFEDYEQRNSLEARLVKAADIIDLLVQVLALERAGYCGLDEFWTVAKKPDFNLQGVSNEVVLEIVNQILSARAHLNAE
jgi:putative hydrolase of HD superfamily